MWTSKFYFKNCVWTETKGSPLSLWVLQGIKKNFLRETWNYRVSNLQLEWEFVCLGGGFTKDLRVSFAKEKLHLSHKQTAVAVLFLSCQSVSGALSFGLFLLVGFGLGINEWVRLHQVRVNTTGQARSEFNLSFQTHWQLWLGALRAGLKKAMLMLHWHHAAVLELQDFGFPGFTEPI